MRLENIGELRRREGIDDPELWDGIHQLAVGDLVRLTLISEAEEATGETLPVRIISIRGHSLVGKLLRKPMSAPLSKLRVGLLISFKVSHIHSIPAENPRSKGTAMTAKKKLPTLSSSTPTASQALPSRSPVLTTEDKLRLTQTLRVRIDELVDRLCQRGGLEGTSVEARERAIAAFHERMVLLEGQLSRILEELRLG